MATLILRYSNNLSIIICDYLYFPKTLLPKREPENMPFRVFNCCIGLSAITRAIKKPKRNVLIIFYEKLFIFLY